MCYFQDGMYGFHFLFFLLSAPRLPFLFLDSPRISPLEVITAPK